MSLVSSQLHPSSNSLFPSPDHTDDDTALEHTEFALSTLLGSFVEHQQLEESSIGGHLYPKSGSHSPESRAFDARIELSTTENASVPHNAPHRNANLNNSDSTSPTPEFGSHTASAYSGSVLKQSQRPYHPASDSSGDMAQPTNPSIAASSPTYPPQGGQYSPYPPQHEMQHAGYPNHPNGTMYQQPRPDWAGYGGHPQHPMQGGYAVSGAQTPTSAAPAGARPGQVYSFVPIPGAQQHKRPRRRYEEIERMYKCGWDGCEKAYGTLNHLNAHVTMQSHGQKRTPEEFKEIRKEWKARKKEEENQRKVDDERARTAAVSGDGHPPDSAPAPGYQQGARSVQLPPIGYQPGAQVPGGQYQPPAAGVQQLQEYGNSHMQYSGYPASPYGAPNMYNNQHNGPPAPKYEQQ